MSAARAASCDVFSVQPESDDNDVVAYGRGVVFGVIRLNPNTSLFGSGNRNTVSAKRGDAPEIMNGVAAIVTTETARNSL